MGLTATAPLPPDDTIEPYWIASYKIGAKPMRCHILIALADDHEARPICPTRMRRAVHDAWPLSQDNLNKLVYPVCEKCLTEATEVLHLKIDRPPANRLKEEERPEPSPPKPVRLPEPISFILATYLTVLHQPKVWHIATTKHHRKPICGRDPVPWSRLTEKPVPLTQEAADALDAPVCERCLKLATGYNIHLNTPRPNLEAEAS
jgi:hypothetical protein